MKRIPGGREVDHSLKSSLQEVRSAIKQINEYAAKLLARGDYGGAEELIPKAREVEKFLTELEAAHNRWREIQGGSDESGGGNEKPLPLWKYYGPTLRIIIELGGAARRESIETKMATMTGETFGEKGSGGVSVLSGLKDMIKRALREMEREGFVQRENREWRITPSGRKAAETK
jgi:hypothetical protein